MKCIIIIYFVINQFDFFNQLSYPFSLFFPHPRFSPGESPSLSPSFQPKSGKGSSARMAVESEGCLTCFAELIAEEIQKQRKFGETQGKQILDILMRPHKHKHRMGLKKKSSASLSGMSSRNTGVDLTGNNWAKPRACMDVCLNATTAEQFFPPV